MKYILNNSNFKNNKNYNTELNDWKNNQKFFINHKIEKKINGSIEILIKSKKINYSNLFINYRNVNQSEKWKRQRIKIKDKKLYTKISNNYLNKNYPIQYYFESIKENYALFCPGINKNLSNQPYYVYNV